MKKYHFYNLRVKIQAVCIIKISCCRCIDQFFLSKRQTLKKVAEACPLNQQYSKGNNRKNKNAPACIQIFFPVFFFFFFLARKPAIKTKSKNRANLRFYLQKKILQIKMQVQDFLSFFLLCTKEQRIMKAKNLTEHKPHCKNK